MGIFSKIFKKRKEKEPDLKENIDLKENSDSKENPDEFLDVDMFPGGDEDCCYKPVIYLYPEEKIDVEVKVDVSELTCTYPKYEDGWKVCVNPHGKIAYRGRVYDSLFWEGNIDTHFDMSKGFCIPGYKTAEFLEEKLEELGLNSREMNEFIVYWLPKMESNNFNLITFQGESYTDKARLTVSPEPDTVIRVFMVWKGLTTPIEVPPQEIVRTERKGFTVVEWGGTEK